MIGSLVEGEFDRSARPPQTTVVGAGIAGLLAAYYLDRRGHEVTLIEASPRAGGLIHTDQTQWGPVEGAAHSFLVTPELAALCHDLGVELVELRQGSSARFIWRDGKTRRFPLSFLEAASAFIRALLIRGTAEVGSFESWGQRHLGRAATHYLLNPFVRGIYGACPGELEMAAAFPQLKLSRNQTLGTWAVSKAFQGLNAAEKKTAMMAPYRGMGSLIEALNQRLRSRLGERFKLTTAATEIPAADNTILAVPASVSARLLASHDPDLSAALESIPYAPLISVTVFLDSAKLSGSACQQLQGVGVLFPENEGREFLGVLFTSSSFEGRVTDESKTISLTVILGGTARPDQMQYSEAQLDEVVRKELQEVFGIQKSAILNHRVCRIPQAVPLYGKSLLRAWACAQRGWCSTPGRLLFGNYTGQVSIRGMVSSAASFAPLATPLH